jgi:hypothetical protein
VSVRRVPEITAEQQNARTVPSADSPGFSVSTLKVDPVEPVPVGSLVARIFRVTGYDPDCDGSLMARLESINADGEPTGWHGSASLTARRSWAVRRGKAG